MPKMKSNRGAAKRFTVTGSGKVKREHAYTGHNFTCKPNGRKNHLQKLGLVAEVDTPRVKKMLAC